MIENLGGIVNMKNKIIAIVNLSHYGLILGISDS